MRDLVKVTENPPLGFLALSLFSFSFQHHLAVANQHIQMNLSFLRPETLGHLPMSQLSTEIKIMNIIVYKFAPVSIRAKYYATLPKIKVKPRWYSNLQYPVKNYFERQSPFQRQLPLNYHGPKIFLHLLCHLFRDAFLFSYLTEGSLKIGLSHDYFFIPAISIIGLAFF